MQALGWPAEGRLQLTSLKNFVPCHPEAFKPQQRPGGVRRTRGTARSQLGLDVLLNSVEVQLPSPLPAAAAPCPPYEEWGRHPALLSG